MAVPSLQGENARCECLGAVPPRAVPTREGDAADALRLVVGYDGSAEARAAFMAAVKRTGADDRIVVAYAQPVSAGEDKPDYARPVGGVLESGHRILYELRGAASQAQAQVRFELHDGPAAEVLARVAAAHDAHEIVVGSRGLGSLQQLLCTADRQVLVVFHDETENGRSSPENRLAVKPPPRTASNRRFRQHVERSIGWRMILGTLAIAVLVAAALMTAQG